MKGKGLKKLKSGDFNNRDDVIQKDGSVIITLSRRSEKVTYRFAVRNLYQADEELLWEEEVRK